MPETENEKGTVPTEGSSSEEAKNTKPTVGELQTPDGDAKVEDKPTEDKDDRVPLAKYMDEKRARREAEENAQAMREDMTKLQAQLANGDKSVGAVSNDLASLAKKYNVDDAFLAELVTTIQSTTSKELASKLEQEYAPKFSQFEQERAQEKADKKFKELYDATIADNPEYVDVVNPDVIKALAFNPANAKKTLDQIIEDVYGKVTKPAKGIERSHPGAKFDAHEHRDAKGGTDWDKVESDPEARKKWADETQEELSKYL